MKLANKFAVVTGASQGLGFAITISEARYPGFERRCVGPKGAIEEVNWAAWTQTTAINLFGTVLCCRTFLPLLQKSARGKILLLSSGGATKPMPFLSAYAASKAAVVRFGETLAEELREAGTDVKCIAPEALNTRILEDVLATGPEKVGRSYYEDSVRQKESGGASPKRAAERCAHLARSESDGIIGELISAVWDPWMDLPDASPRPGKDGRIYAPANCPQRTGLPWG
jgi:3-oxoacyl-[acyl-carrier protein] reductase